MQYLKTFAKRCKLENSSKNTAKSIVFKVQKSDAPKNKSQLASRGVPRPPGTPLIYVPAYRFILLIRQGTNTNSKNIILTYKYYLCVFVEIVKQFYKSAESINQSNISCFSLFQCCLINSIMAKRLTLDIDHQGHLAGQIVTLDSISTDQGLIEIIINASSSRILSLNGCSK